MDRKELSGQCVTCHKETKTVVTYAGAAVGFYCEEHRPDIEDRAKTKADILETFKTFELSDGSFKTIFPIFMKDIRHPLHTAALEWVKSGRAIWYQPTLSADERRGLGIPNRAERRRMRNVQT